MAEGRKKRLPKSWSGISDTSTKDLEGFFKERGINIKEKITQLGMILLKHKILNEKKRKDEKRSNVKFDKMEYEDAEILISAKLRGKISFRVRKIEDSEGQKGQIKIACKSRYEKEGIEI